MRFADNREAALVTTAAGNVLVNANLETSPLQIRAATKTAGRFRIRPF